MTKEEREKIRQLPRSLDEALDALEADQDFLTEGGVFPQKLIDIWIENRRADSQKYNMLPQPVEFEMYYDL